VRARIFPRGRDRPVDRHGHANASIGGVLNPLMLGLLYLYSRKLKPSPL
jgi:hypothetical protein